MPTLSPTQIKQITGRWWEAHQELLERLHPQVQSLIRRYYGLDGPALTYLQLERQVGLSRRTIEKRIQRAYVAAQAQDKARPTDELSACRSIRELKFATHRQLEAARILDLLHDMGIHTLRDLTGTAKDWLLVWPGFSKAFVDLVRVSLSYHGLALAGEEVWRPQKVTLARNPELPNCYSPAWWQTRLSLVNRLDETVQRVLKLYYGLDGLSHQPLGEIAQATSLTPRAVKSLLERGRLAVASMYLATPRDIPIEDLLTPLGGYLKHQLLPLLAKMNIASAQDLRDVTADWLKAWPSFGPVYLDAVRLALFHQGLALRGENPSSPLVQLVDEEIIAS
ncbi:MAG TPA: sigma-70 region 4 domain-containing protein [Candidatus Saccharimonadia bacterium]|nr:sigma-70 region 4 domain-containing protein [Candidatus Saccharimonadia bacterium]